jgi:tetratricopeptide (TPR) repeat protein
VYERKGEKEKAGEYYEKYLQMAVLDEGERNTPNAIRREICGRERLGDLALDREELTVARRYFEECLELWRRLLDLDEDSPHRSMVANAHMRLGNTLKKQGDLNGAAEQYRLALEINEEFEKHNAAGNRCFDLADLCEATERVEYLRRALAHYRQGKESRYYLVQRGRVCLELAKMVQKTNANEARTLFHESCELLRDTLEEKPKRVDLRNLATAYCSMGNFLHDQKENAAADWYLQEALLLRQRIAELWGENENETAKQAAILCYLGNVHSGERAEGYYQRSLALYEQLAAAYPEEQMYRNNVASLQKRKK